MRNENEKTIKWVLGYWQANAKHPYHVTKFTFTVDFNIKFTIDSQASF